MTSGTMASSGSVRHTTTLVVEIHSEAAVKSPIGLAELVVI
jgi:hypothetical protein